MYTVVVPVFVEAIVETEVIVRVVNGPTAKPYTAKEATTTTETTRTELIL